MIEHYIICHWDALERTAVTDYFLACSGENESDMYSATINEDYYAEVNEPTSSGNVGAIAGGVVAAGAVLIIIIVVVILLANKWRQRQATDTVQKVSLVQLHGFVLFPYFLIFFMLHKLALKFLSRWTNG